MQLLVCLERGSPTLTSVRAHRAFAVNLLRDTDESLSRLFASKRPSRERFALVGHRLEHGVPVLDDALAWLTCEVAATHPGGDRVIVVGAVTGLRHGLGDPLVWYDGRHHVLA